MIARPRQLSPASSIGDHRDLVALGPEPQHRAQEVVPGGAEEPRAANDPSPLAGDLLACELGAPVDRERPGRVGLEVGLALLAAKDVVTGVVDERCPQRGDVTSPADVRPLGAVRIGLGAVHIGPGGGV